MEVQKLDAQEIFSHTAIKEFIARKKVSEKELSERNIYNFCPHCRERVRRGNLDPKSNLKPMLSVLYRVCYRIGDMAAEEWERAYECQLCKDARGNRRVITEDDFSETIGGIAYAKRHREDDKLFYPSDEELARRGFMLAEKPWQAEEERGIFDETIFDEI